MLNSKGFGGNNATASVLSPAITKRMLEAKHGKGSMQSWKAANEKVQKTAVLYQQKTNHEQITPIYRFDHDVKTDADVSFSDEKLKVRGYAGEINLDLANPYPDMMQK